MENIPEEFLRYKREREEREENDKKLIALFESASIPELLGHLKIGGIEKFVGSTYLTGVPGTEYMSGRFAEYHQYIASRSFTENITLLNKDNEHSKFLLSKRRGVKKTIGGDERYYSVGVSWGMEGLYSDFGYALKLIG